MQKWLTDGLIVSFITIAVGGISALTNNVGVTLAGSTLGAATSSAILSRRKGQALSNLTHQLENAQASLLTTPADEVITSSREPDIVTNLARGDTEKVVAWLEAKNISVESHRLPDDAIDSIFNKHAIFLGERYKDNNQEPLLAPLLKSVKWAISQNRNIQIHLKNAPQAQIASQTQFCRNLYEDTLLSSYRYVKATKMIHAIVQDRGDIKNFFNGDWFERFICYKMCQLLDNLELTYSYLMNPIVKFSNGDTFELDLFFLIEENPLLIECKTGGDFNAHLKKFSDHCKRLSISPSKAFLVILDLEEAQTESLSGFWKFRVVNQDNFLPILESMNSQLT